MAKPQNNTKQVRKRSFETTDRLEIKNIKRNGAKLLFGDKCQDCGYDEHWEVLEFHHKVPRSISGRPKFSAILENSWDFIRDEVLEHCVLLCPTCHKIRHMKEDYEGRFGSEIDI